MRSAILKVVTGIMVFTVIVGISALLATVYATRQISSALQKTKISNESSISRTESLVPVDFYLATGIKKAELQQWFRSLETSQNLTQVRLILTFSNNDGHCLVDSPVALRWAGGILRTHIGSSGLGEFPLSAEQLDDLQVLAPAEYSILKQRTFSIGHAYEKPPEPELLQENLSVVNDDTIQQALFRNLQKIRLDEPVFRRLNAAESLRRPTAEVRTKEIQTTLMSAEEIQRRYRSSVVVIGMLQPDGIVSQGTGFVIASTGVIVTNFHVVNKPHAVAAGVLTDDLRFFELKEFLAGRPHDDLALIRINADDLQAIPLAEQNASVGTEIQAITHPDSHYFSMTFGRATRYFQTTRHARMSLRMGVTADFSEGSSGGPLMDNRGHVVGIVSATRGDSHQMVHREAIPVSSLLRLVGRAAEQKSPTVAPVISLESQDAPTNLSRSGS